MTNTAFRISMMPTFDRATGTEVEKPMRMNDGSLIIRRPDDGVDDEDSLGERLIVPRVVYVKRSEAYTADDPAQMAFAQRAVDALNASDASPIESVADLAALVEACEKEFTTAKTEGGSFTYGESDDSEVAYPLSNITFGHIRRARAGINALIVQSAEPPAQAETETPSLPDAVKAYLDALHDLDTPVMSPALGNHRKQVVRDRLAYLRIAHAMVIPS